MVNLWQKSGWAVWLLMAIAVSAGVTGCSGTTNPNGSDSADQVTQTLGETVQPYSAKVLSKNTLELLSHPNKDQGYEVAKVKRDELVTVSRSYKDRSGKVWVFITGARGQEGWINSQRLTRT
ncbi:hypothetical protein ACN4EK_22600 [Pantanalinema rosaneae CENA516]|uniref:hypothetical protein n=1 Tax=Pantanalinema rosaneae TaxID=1620701 RepID=UPI003D6FB46B